MRIALDTIDIASPCSANWDEMRGDEKSRHCEHCDKTVHDLTALGRDGAEALLDADPNRCVRFYRNSDGIVWAAQAVRPTITRRGWLAAAAALAAGLVTRRAMANSEVVDPGASSSVCAPPAQPKVELKGKATVEPSASVPTPQVVTLESLLKKIRVTTGDPILPVVGQMPRTQPVQHKMMGKMAVVRPPK